MYSYIFYYIYTLLKKTKPGTGVADTCLYLWLLIMIHVSFLSILSMQFFNVDILFFLDVSGPYLIRKYKLIPYAVVSYIACYAYFKWRFPKIKQKFSAYTDKEILCWKNHVFVILVTLIPLAIIIYIASHY